MAELPETAQGLKVMDEGDRIRIGEDVGERLSKQLQRATNTDESKRDITDSILERINRKASEGSYLKKGVLRKVLFNNELTLTQEEEWILDAPYEIVVAYAPNGRLVKGVTEHHPEQSPVPQGLMEGSIFTHQHPGGRGPSAWDLEYLSRNRGLVSRVVTVNESGRIEIFEISVSQDADPLMLKDAVDFYRNAVDSHGNTAPARRAALELLSSEFPATFLAKSRVL